jgi:hypothetical protein
MTTAETLLAFGDGGWGSSARDGEK